MRSGSYSQKAFHNFCRCKYFKRDSIFVFLGKHFDTDASLELLSICRGSNDAQFKAVDTDLKLKYLNTAITKVP